MTFWIYFIATIAHSLASIRYIFDEPKSYICIVTSVIRAILCALTAYHFARPHLSAFSKSFYNALTFVVHRFFPGAHCIEAFGIGASRTNLMFETVLISTIFPFFNPDYRTSQSGTVLVCWTPVIMQVGVHQAVSHLEDAVQWICLALVCNGAGAIWGAWLGVDRRRKYLASLPVGRRRSLRSSSSSPSRHRSPSPSRSASPFCFCPPSCAHTRVVPALAAAAPGLPSPLRRDAVEAQAPAGGTSAQRSGEGAWRCTRQLSGWTRRSDESERSGARRCRRCARRGPRTAPTASAASLTARTAMAGETQGITKCGTSSGVGRVEGSGGGACGSARRTSLHASLRRRRQGRRRRGRQTGAGGAQDLGKEPESMEQGDWRTLHAGNPGTRT